MSLVDNPETGIMLTRSPPRSRVWRIGAATVACVEILFTVFFWYLAIVLGPPLAWPLTAYVWTAQVANGTGFLTGLVVLTTALVVLVRNLIGRKWARLFLCGAIAVNIGDVIWQCVTFGRGYWGAPAVAAALAVVFITCCIMYWRRSYRSASAAADAADA